MTAHMPHAGMPLEPHRQTGTLRTSVPSVRGHVPGHEHRSGRCMSLGYGTDECHLLCVTTRPLEHVARGVCTGHAEFSVGHEIDEARAGRASDALYR